MNDTSLVSQQQDPGILSVEQSRAIQEVQAQMIVAKRFPRDEIEARTRIVKACESKSLAHASQYVYTRGGTQITGPSIRLAEVMARYWRNVNYGLQEITQEDGSSDVVAFAWDLESNVRVTRQFKAKHTRKARGEFYDLVDPRDIYEMVANQGQRRVRACILELIPGDIVEEAIEACDNTLKSGHKEPLEKRITKMVQAFDKLGVSQQAIEQKLGHPAKAIIEQELINLGKIYNSIKDGIGKREDFFQIGAKKEEDSPEAKDLTEQLHQDGEGIDDTTEQTALFSGAQENDDLLAWLDECQGVRKQLHGMLKEKKAEAEITRIIGRSAGVKEFKDVPKEKRSKVLDALQAFVDELNEG